MYNHRSNPCVTKDYKGYRSHKVHYKKLNAEYIALEKETGFFTKGKAQKARAAANEYYKKHRMEITLYESAERYLKGVLQERFDPKKLPPVTKWKAEREKLSAEKNKLNQQYVALKGEVKEVEQIRKEVYGIMRQEVRRTEPQRSRGMDR